MGFSMEFSLGFSLGFNSGSVQDAVQDSVWDSVQDQCRMQCGILFGILFGIQLGCVRDQCRMLGLCRCTGAALPAGAIWWHLPPGPGWGRCREGRRSPGGQEEPAGSSSSSWLAPVPRVPGMCPCLCGSDPPREGLPWKEDSVWSCEMWMWHPWRGGVLSRKGRVAFSCQVHSDFHFSRLYCMFCTQLLGR